MKSFKYEPGVINSEEFVQLKKEMAVTKAQLMQVESEKENLEKQSRDLGLERTITFTGWVDHSETGRYYNESDLFCFPSVREFGGAVALEAMAAGLPCVVADHGGLGEYVTEVPGFKIKPISRNDLVEGLAQKITTLFADRDLLYRMSLKSIERVKEFEWGTKADRLMEIYMDMVGDERLRIADRG